MRQATEIKQLIEDALKEIDFESAGINTKLLPFLTFKQALKEDKYTWGIELWVKRIDQPGEKILISDTDESTNDSIKLSSERQAALDQRGQPVTNDNAALVKQPVGKPYRTCCRFLSGPEVGSSKVNATSRDGRPNFGERPCLVVTIADYSRKNRRASTTKSAIMKFSSRRVAASFR